MPGARCCTAGWVDTNSQIIYIHGGRGFTAQSQANIGAIAGIIEALANFFFFFKHLFFSKQNCGLTTFRPTRLK